MSNESNFGWGGEGGHGTFGVVWLLLLLPESNNGLRGRSHPWPASFPNPALYSAASLFPRIYLHFPVHIFNNLFLCFLAIIRGRKNMASCMDRRILGHETIVLEKVQRHRFRQCGREDRHCIAVGRTATERKRGNKNVHEEFYIICSRSHDGRNARRNSNGHHRRYGS